MEPRLTGQPERGPAGLHSLGVAGDRDTIVYVPPRYDPARRAPLALVLHGAGGNADHGLRLLMDFADDRGLILLAPVSRARTWDVIVGEYGPDVEAIDEALRWTFDRYAVDRGHLAIGGFSDGASYALSVGLMNGNLFSHVIAFSPGFMAPAGEEGRPRVFISHGVHDTVLPIDRCSRRIVPRLTAAGYDVDYREFDGPHTVPADMARGAVEWFIGPPE